MLVILLLKAYLQQNQNQQIVKKSLKFTLIKFWKNKYWVQEAKKFEHWSSAC